MILTLFFIFVQAFTFYQLITLVMRDPLKTAMGSCAPPIKIIIIVIIIIIIIIIFNTNAKRIASLLVFTVVEIKIKLTGLVMILMILHHST